MTLIDEVTKVLRELGRAHDEVERLTIENWQLKGALGYPTPSNIPETTEFKCGLCEARRRTFDEEQDFKERMGL